MMHGRAFWVAGAVRIVTAVVPVVVLLAQHSISAAAEKAAQRPNIVLIMADDMGFSDVGCYGGEIHTPHLDRMAAGGMRFTQFYNNAKCTTTRASLITGLYPRRKGPLLQPKMVTIAEVLGAAGYSTCLSGKWHLGSQPPRRPSDRGFDRYFGLLDGCCNFFDPSMPDPKFKGGRIRFVAQDDVRITKFPDDFYMTDAISDYAVDYIGAAASAGKPFFLHVCYTAPHYPLHAKPADIARYRGTYRKKGWAPTPSAWSNRPTSSRPSTAQSPKPAKAARPCWNASPAKNPTWRSLRSRGFRFVNACDIAV